MSESGRTSFVRSLLWIGAPVVVLAAVRPWTIRPLEQQKPVSFDAATFVTSAWPRLVREATQTAVDLADVPAPGGASPAKARFVKGTGAVDVVDRQSRAGVMRVRLSASGMGPSLVAIQIGPVIRGTALRDATGFIQFSDFTNQTDYAGAANALNDHVLGTVVMPFPLESVSGRTISFVGAVAKSPVRDDGAIEVVPVRLELVEAPRR